MKKETNMKTIVAAVLAIGLIAMGAQAALVDITIDPVDATHWTVKVAITAESGDTIGMSGYGLKVIDTAGVSWEPVLESILNQSYQTVGMVNATASYVGADYKFGNYQNFGAAAIEGIGMVVVDMDTPSGPTPANLYYGVPALLGTLTTPVGLGPDDFAGDGIAPIGLLNAGNTGYVSNENITVTLTVTPEPVTLLVLLGGAALGLIRRR